MPTIKDQARNFWLKNHNATMYDSLAEAKRLLLTEAQQIEFARAVIEIQGNNRQIAEDCERIWPERKGY